jgi:hypothetical protein
MLQAQKIGFIFRPDGQTSWWRSHAMAPAPILMPNGVVRVYLGCWTEDKISRMGYVDVLAARPTEVVGVSSAPVLDIGTDGCFDENGVFPAHAYDFGDGTVHLYYTGFQLGHKIRHYNFGGLAISHDGGSTFERFSEAPVMDRADEGLFVRAGQSIERADEGGFHVIYSAGSSWHMCQGELRPVYDVLYQKSPDGIALSKTGRKIVTCDLNVEHGLGRPQILKFGDYFYAFYTRRIIEDMRYFLGCARSKDCENWERIDHVFDGIAYGSEGEFDHEMVYFPAVVKVSETKALLFYSGNYFGRDGMGAIELRLA